MRKEKSFLFWFALLSLLTGLLIVQTTFLPSAGRFSLFPYLIWPPVLFFFLYQDSFSSLILLFAMSLLSSWLFSLSPLAVFFMYFLCFLSVFVVKNFFMSKSPLIFFTLTFVISWSFPYLTDLFYNFSINDFSLSTSFFYFSKAFMTLLLSVLLFPFLEKYLQNQTGF